MPEGIKTQKAHYMTKLPLEFFIPVSMGDTVRVKTDDNTEKTVFIMAVFPQYELTEDKLQRQSPKLAVMSIDDSSDCLYVSNSNVIEILQYRPPNVRTITNVYETLHDSYRSRLVRRGGTLTGDIITLGYFCMSRLPYPIQQPPDPVKLKNLYFRSMVGLVKKEGDMITVREKSFMKWIKANHTRIILSRQKMERMKSYLPGL